MKRVAKILTSLFTVVVMLLVGFHLVENWRGKRAWERWKAERTALGNHYEWSALAPPEVPDAENFAKAPIVESAIKGTNSILGEFRWPEMSAGGVSSWRLGKREDLDAWREAFKNRNLEAALEPCKSVLDELSLAIGRAHSRLPITYSFPEYMKVGYPPLLGMRSAGKALRLRALVRLDAGKPAEALEDVLSLLRFGQQFREEPVLLAHLLHTALIGHAMQPIWEGVSAHHWNEKQLLSLQQELEGIDLLRSHRLALEGERLIGIQNMLAMADAPSWERAKAAGTVFEDDELRTSNFRTLRAWLILPKGWIYQNMVNDDRFFLETWLPAVDVAHHRLNAEVLKAAANDLERRRPSPYNSTPSFGILAYLGQSPRIAERQNAVDEAVMACALERYRLKNKMLPATLEELSPTYLARTTQDLLTGKPLQYQSRADGSFLLGSPGWNLAPGASDKPFQDTRTSFQPGEGSWLWPMRKK